MKYIKGVNLNQNDEAYIKQHFEEEDNQALQTALTKNKTPLI